MLLFIAYFAKSCIEQFAQQRAAELDQVELSKIAQASGFQQKEKKKN